MKLLERALRGDVAAATLARDCCHEKLHTGDWNAVDVVWRDAYTLAVLQLLKRCSEASIEERGRAADLAVLLGGPLWRGEVDEAIERLSTEARVKRRRAGVTVEPLPLLGLVPSTGLASVPPGAGVGGLPRYELPSLDAFARECFQPRAPAVLLGVLDGWPALTRWRDLHYLIDVAGERTVPVEVGAHYLADGWNQQLMPLERFLRTCIHAADSADSRGYLAQHDVFEQAPALRRDFTAPDYVCLGGGELRACNAWLGPAGTVTPLHTDPHHNLLCQVVGVKHARLYAPQHGAALYPHAAPPFTNSSRVNAFAPDDVRFPRFAGAPFVDVDLQPGEVLYIPPGWWHTLVARTSSFSVSFWWG